MGFMIFLSVLSSYYILVNTVLANSVLPNVTFNEQNLSLMSEEELEEFINEEIINQFSATLDIFAGGKQFTISTADLNIEVSSDSVLKYGKGSNLIDVLRQTFSLVNGEELPIEITLDVDLVIENLPFEIDSFFSARIEGDEILNCSENKFNVDYIGYMANKVLESCNSNCFEGCQVYHHYSHHHYLSRSFPLYR